MAVLVVLTLLTVTKEMILTHHLIDGFSGAPSNVVDLASYFGVGIFIGSHWLYLLVAILLLLAFLLTQSHDLPLSLLYALGVLWFLQPAV